MSRKPRHLPGNQFVALDILCRPCLDSGRRHRLARFGIYTYPGADPEPWVEYRHDSSDGALLRAAWTDGPDGVDKVHLGCACGHTPQIRRDQIAKWIDAVRVDGRRVGRIPL